MELSIIIPAYNVEQYLERCVLSVINQNLSDYEILIINDGSKDNTLIVANALADKFENINVISQDNKGISAVRNLGIKLSKGKYILYLDSDDFYNPNCLNYLLDIMRTHDLDALQFGYEKNTTGKSKLIDLNSKIDILTREEFLENIFFCQMVWNKIIKKELLIRESLTFEEVTSLEDDYFCTELFLKSSKLGNTSLIVYNYFHNTESIMRTRNRKHEFIIIDDFVFSVNKHIELYNYARDKKMSKAVLKNLLERRESFVFFMITRLLRLKVDYKTMQEYLSKCHFNKFQVFPNKYRCNFKQKVIYKTLKTCFINKNIFKLIIKFNYVKQD